MKKQNKKLSCLLFISMLLLCLSGCSHTKDLNKELSSLRSGEKTSDASAKSKDAKRLDFEILSENGKFGFKVDAVPDTVGETSVAVYKEHARAFDKNEFQRLAKKLFDEGKFSYCKPVSAWTREEVLERKRQENIKEEKKGLEITTGDCWNYYYNNLKQWNAASYKEGEFCKGNELTFYDEIILAKGEIDQKQYVLCAVYSNKEPFYMLRKEEDFIEFKLGFQSNVMPYADMDSKDPSTKYQTDQLMQNEWEDTSQLQKEYDGENPSLSKEDTEKLAVDFMQRWFEEDFGVVKTNIVTQSGNDTDTASKLAGYAVYLQRSVDHMLVNQKNYWWNYDLEEKENSDEYVPKQELYRVEVKYGEISKVEIWGNCYEVEETLVDHVELMDFSTIVTIAKDSLQQTIRENETLLKGNVSKNVETLTNVNLRYVTVSYKGQLTLIPAWFFETFHETKCVVNAMDGSVIFVIPKIN